MASSTTHDTDDSLTMNDDDEHHQQNNTTVIESEREQEQSRGCGLQACTAGLIWAEPRAATHTGSTSIRSIHLWLIALIQTHNWLIGLITIDLIHWSHYSRNLLDS